MRRRHLAELVKYSSIMMIKTWSLAAYYFVELIKKPSFVIRPLEHIYSACDWILIVELRNETLVITAYERFLGLYIDDQMQSLTNGGTWNLPDYIQLLPTNRLIAVEAANLAIVECGGVLASVYDGSLLTNSEWKCTSFDEVNWANLGFDDSNWPNAIEYGSNGNHSNCSQQQLVEDISSNSKWIWTSNLGDFAVYCRGYLRKCHCFLQSKFH